MLLVTSALAGPKPKPCDATALVAAARELSAIGQPVAALAKLDEALRCQPSEATNKLAAWIACDLAWRARHGANAEWEVKRFKRYYDKLSPASQRSVAQCWNRCGGI